MFGNNTVDDSVVNDNSQAMPEEELIPATFPPTDNQSAMPTMQDQTATYTPQDQTTEYAQPTDNSMSASSGGANDNLNNDDLVNLKRDALGQLNPLLGQLDQSPEDRFKTTMMMIQASDDKSLLNTAYTNALQITDEKVRAQALLDVVNEINYFMHPESN